MGTTTCRLDRGFVCCVSAPLVLIALSQLLSYRPSLLPLSGKGKVHSTTFQVNRPISHIQPRLRDFGSRHPSFRYLAILITMKGFTATALAGAALFLTANADVDPIVIKGSKFFYQTNGTQFFIKGIAYQQALQAVTAATSTHLLTAHHARETFPIFNNCRPTPFVSMRSIRLRIMINACRCWPMLASTLSPTCLRQAIPSSGTVLRGTMISTPAILR